MINKGVRLTTGLLVAALLVTAVPADVFEAAPVESANYITGTTYSFSAGAHSAISETVVLESIGENDYLADVEENDAPTVTTPEVDTVNPYANIAIASKINEYLNIRSEASKESEVLGKLYKNGAATVLEVLDGWYKVKSGSVTGYISADYVVVGDEATCKAASTRVGKVTAASLRLRKKASTDAEVKTLISEGKTVTVLDESIDGWYKVSYKSYTGYVSADYVKVTTEYTYAESKEEEKARLKEEEEARKEAEKKKNNKNNKNNKNDKTYSKPTSKNGQAVVDYAVQFVGNPYKWGGTSLTKGADCSGFVMKVYEAFGIKLPHSSYDLRKVGKKVKASEMQPGDIICYSGHVAIYMGNGKIVHASNKKDGIKISNNYKYKKVLAIRRVID